MKCYQIAGLDIVAGLPVQPNADGRPFVVIGNKKAVLSNALIELNPGSRVLDCDLNVLEGGEIELVPPKGPSTSVIVAYQLADSLEHVKSWLSTATAGGVIAISSETQRYIPYLAVRHGEGVLARIEPGCLMQVIKTTWKLKPAPSGWRGVFARRAYTQESVVVDFLRLTQEGTIELCKKEKLL